MHTLKVKKILRAALLFLLCYENILAYADDNGTLTYSISGQKITVTGCVDVCATILAIPDLISGMPVVSIGSSAFSNSTSLTAIELPDSLTNIGDNAFNRSAIRSLDIPDSVTSIGAFAFRGSSLVSVKLPSNLSSIASGLFLGVSGLTEITLPDTVTGIGTQAFYGTGLTSISIPDAVTTIGTQAFYNVLDFPDFTRH